MRSRRGCGVPLALVGTVLAVSALTSCGTASVWADVLPGAVRIDADYYVSEYGVRVGIRAGYPESRVVTEARLVTRDGSVAVPLYPLDGTDPDEPPESVTLGPGDQVLLEGALLARCPSTRDLPVFEVVSHATGAGSERTDRFAPADVRGYQRAVKAWCSRPLTMHVTGSSVTPEGDYTLHVELSNPHPDPVTVTSEQVVGSSSWQEATVVVPGGSIEQMTIHGHGPPECAATPPWETGDVRADGRVITPKDSDGWC